MSSALLRWAVGPVLAPGSPLQPDPWLDTIAASAGLQLGERFPDVGPPATPSGTVAVTNGSTAVVGTGTAFTTELSVNSRWWITQGSDRLIDKWDSGAYNGVASIEDDTHLTLTSNWAGSTASGLSIVTWNESMETLWGGFINYYDLGLCLWVQYVRTGDERYRTYANKVASAWWGATYYTNSGATAVDSAAAPRIIGLCGLILSAHDEDQVAGVPGTSKLWDWLYRYTDYHRTIWLTNHINDSELYTGLRDGAFAFHFALYLSRFLPDTYTLYGNGTKAASTGTATDGAAKRAALIGICDDLVADYYDRLQYPDGSFRWVDDFPPQTGSNDTEKGEVPFHCGLLMHALADYTRHPDAANVATAGGIIVAHMEHVIDDCYEAGTSANVTNFPTYYWRDTLYQRFSDNPTPSGDRDALADSEPFSADLNRVIQERQNTSTLIGAFGEAYRISGTATFKTIGDDAHEACFGYNVSGDGLRAGIYLIDNSGGRTAKTYCENMRMCMRYAELRLGRTMNVTPGNTSSQGFTLANLTATLSHDHDGDYLVVGVAAGFSDGAGVPASVTYDGVAMSLLTSVAFTSNCGVGIYGLTTSNTGVHDVVVTYPVGEATRCVVCAFSASNVVSVDTTTVGITGASTDAPLTVTNDTTPTAALADLVVDMLATGHTSSGDAGVTGVTAGSGQTLVGTAQSNDSTTGVRGAMSHESGSDAVVTMSWSVAHGGISAKYRHALIVLQGAAAATETDDRPRRRVIIVRGGGRRRVRRGRR